jgi:hypothetical protein
MTPLFYLPGLSFVAQQLIKEQKDQECDSSTLLRSVYRVNCDAIAEQWTEPSTEPFSSLWVNLQRTIIRVNAAGIKNVFMYYRYYILQNEYFLLPVFPNLCTSFINLTRKCGC